MTNEDRDMIRALEQLLDAPLERLTLQGFDYAKPAPDKEPTPFAATTTACRKKTRDWQTNSYEVNISLLANQGIILMCSMKPP